MRDKHVDEDYLMNLIAGGVPRSKPETPPPKCNDETTQTPEKGVDGENTEAQPKSRRISKAETERYLDTFFRGDVIHDRKAIYVGSEVYNLIYDEVYAIAGRKVSVSTFAEALFREHFKEHAEIITQIKKRKIR
ncbi:MAG: DUF3408 domain-containing protein [Rikenellaceae bacterium]